VTVLAVISETQPLERRVAVVPAEIPRLHELGLEVVVQAGAGESAGFSDDAYRESPATTVVSSRGEALAGAEIVAKVRPPTREEVNALPEGSALLCFLPPSANLELVSRLRDRHVTTFSFDLIPRISRAQAMDALSSQAGVVGYQAAVLAAARLNRVFPMMMTAAGTVPPARVLVMGAGVAGLQAIATTRRLGAAVSAYDVRPEAADEIRSLGATFVELPLEARQGSGGYAAEQSSDFLARQQELIADTVARSDAVITTAAVPGRAAPRLVSTAMVDRMRPGSVIVDVAASSGGNCELTRDGEEFEHGGVLIIGAGDLASQAPATSSALYARNVSSLVGLLVRDGKLEIDFSDDIVAGACLTWGGLIRHEPTRAIMEGASE
jgi:NAD(P) transhydrogenase subunit alpha